MRLSDWVAHFIEKQGIRHVFTLTGGFSMYLTDSFGRSNVTLVNLLHEQSCSFAAEAYAQIRGLGVCLVTGGPGATNAVTGCASCWNNYSPVLFISGQVMIKDMKKEGQRFNGDQEVDIISIIQPITAYAVQITDVNYAEEIFSRAIMEAKSSQAPVWIDIPLDMQMAEVA